MDILDKLSETIKIIPREMIRNANARICTLYLKKNL